MKIIQDALQSLVSSSSFRTNRPVWLIALLGTALPTGSLGQGMPEIVWSTNLYAPGKPVLSLSFSPDGAFLASGMDRTARVWRVSDGGLLHSFSMPVEVTAVAISPGGTLLGAGDGIGTRAVWRLTDSIRLWLGQGNDRDERSSVHAMTFSPDGNALYVGSGKGISAVTPSGSGLPFESDPERGVYALRFSPSGTVLASGNADGTASLFRMPGGSLLRQLAGHPGSVLSVDFSPDGALLASAAGDGKVRLWRTEDGSLVRVIAWAGGRVCFSADGTALLSSDDRNLRFWQVSDGRLLCSFPNLGARAFAVSPDGQHFAYGTGGVLETHASVVLARMPTIVTKAEKRTEGFNFAWQGGSGVYQVQTTSNVVAGPWEDLGPPTTNTSLSVPITNPAAFFRLQSLTNAP